MDFPYKTKTDVDQYADFVLKRLCKSDQEKNQEAREIGILYFYVKAYDPAIRYFKMYLSIEDNAPHIHQLLGQSYEQLGMADEATACYKRCTELNSTQPDLSRLICDILRGSGMTKENSQNEDRGLSLSRLILQNLKDKIAKVANANFEILESCDEPPPDVKPVVEKKSTEQNNCPETPFQSQDVPIVIDSSPVRVQPIRESAAPRKNNSVLSLLWNFFWGENRNPEVPRPPSPDVEILHESLKPPAPEIEIVEELCNGIAGLNTSESDVNIVWEQSVPRKDRNAAEALQLPPNFFNSKKRSKSYKTVILE